MKIAFILIVPLINVVACNNNSSNHSCYNNVNVRPQGAARLTKEQAAIKQLQDYVNKSVHDKANLWIILVNIQDEGVLSQKRLQRYSLLEKGKYNGMPKQLAELILGELRVIKAIKLLLEYIRNIDGQGAYIIDPEGHTILGLLNDFNVEGVFTNVGLREYKDLWKGELINKDKSAFAHAILYYLGTNYQVEEATGFTQGVAALFVKAIERLRAYEKKNWPMLVDVDGVELFKILDEINLLGVLSNRDLKQYEEFRREVSEDPEEVIFKLLENLKRELQEKRGNQKIIVPPAVEIRTPRQCLTLKAVEKVKEYIKSGADPNGDRLFQLLSKFLLQDVICRCELRGFTIKFRDSLINLDPLKLADEVINTLVGPRYFKCCGSYAVAALNITNTTGPTGPNKYEKAIIRIKDYIRKIENRGVQKYDPKGDILLGRLTGFARDGVFSQLKLLDYLKDFRSGKFYDDPEGLAEKVLIDIQVTNAVDQLTEYRKKNWPVPYDRNGDQIWGLLNDYEEQGFLHQPIIDYYRGVWNGVAVNKNPYAFATYVAVNIQELHGNVNGNANATVIHHGK